MKPRGEQYPARGHPELVPVPESQVSYLEGLRSLNLKASLDVDGGAQLGLALGTGLWGQVPQLRRRRD